MRPVPALLILAAMAVLSACERARDEKAAKTARLEAAVDAPAPAAAAETQAEEGAPEPGMVAPGFPRLAARGATAGAFVPRGWRLEHAVKGDFSGDGVADLVMVIQADNEENWIVEGPAENARVIDANSRILAFALGAPEGYRLAGQNHTLIPLHDNPFQDDPLGEAPVIRNGVATVKLTLFMSAGGGDMGSYYYRFRHQDGGVKLIGYDHNLVERMTGDTADLSVNLLTMKRVDKVGNIESDRKRTFNTGVAVGAIPLEMLGDGFSFEEEQLTG